MSGRLSDPDSESSHTLTSTRRPDPRQTPASTGRLTSGAHTPSVHQRPREGLLSFLSVDSCTPETGPPVPPTRHRSEVPPSSGRRVLPTETGLPTPKGWSLPDVVRTPLSARPDEGGWDTPSSRSPVLAQTWWNTRRGRMAELGFRSQK